MSQRFVLRGVADKQSSLAFELSPGGELTVGKATRPLRILRRDGNGLLTALWGDEILTGVIVCAGEKGDQLELLVDGHKLTLQLRTAAVDAMEQGLASAHSGDSLYEVSSPIPGLVKAVLVKVGDTVAAGQNLIVLEAMKMENEITAPHGGVVDSIEAKAGQAVAAGALLLRIKNGV